MEFSHGLLHRSLRTSLLILYLNTLIVHPDKGCVPHSRHFVRKTCALCFFGQFVLSIFTVGLSHSGWLVALFFAPRLSIKLKPFTFIAVLSVLALINLPHPWPDLSNTVVWFQYSRLRGTYQIYHRAHV